MKNHKYANKRYIQFHFRVSEEEMVLLMYKSKLAGVTPSEFMRRLLLGKQLKYRPPVYHNDSGIEEALRLVSKEVSSLNQIARYFNEHKETAPDINDYLRTALSEIHSNCIKLGRAISEEYGDN